MSETKISTPPPSENGTSEVQIVNANQQTGIQAMGNNLGAIISAGSNVDLSKKKASAVNLNTGFLKFELEGEMVRRQFLGMTLEMSVDPTTGEEKGLVDAAVLYDPATGKVETAMQSVIASNLKKVQPSTMETPTFVEITFIGRVKSKTGLFYQDFDIRTLED